MGTKAGQLGAKQAQILAAGHRLAKPGERVKIADIVGEMGLEDTKTERNNISKSIVILRETGRWPFAGERGRTGGRRFYRKPAETATVGGEKFPVINLTPGWTSRNGPTAPGPLPAPPAPEPVVVPQGLSDIEALARLDELFDGLSARGRQVALQFLSARFGRD